MTENTSPATFFVRRASSPGSSAAVPGRRSVRPSAARPPAPPPVLRTALLPAGGRGWAAGARPLTRTRVGVRVYAVGQQALAAVARLP
jgi:hypothetical protein